MRSRNTDGTYTNAGITHGTPSGYNYWHCHCDKCKFAHAVAARRTRNKKRGLPLPDYQPESPRETDRPLTLTSEHRWTRERGWFIPE